ncbi:hypothetical protein [Methylobacterium sp. Leaf125]|uniref:hypothetical protein n=1 Tax=Methylobacterium sp. Leaf125 TaxID=1736265 RepID=UPI001FCD981A|nr:hypothetical protein [Methylobacterium sp. Leaf125]
MLDVVAPQQDQLPLTVEFVDVDDAEARLAAAGRILAGEGRSLSAEPPDQEDAGRENEEDDDEDDGELEGKRAIRAEER